VCYIDHGVTTYIDLNCFNFSFKFCDIDPNFGEFGVYDLKASGTAEEPKCDLTVVADPVNIYLRKYWKCIIQYLIIEILFF